MERPSPAYGSDPPHGRRTSTAGVAEGPIVRADPVQRASLAAYELLDISKGADGRCIHYPEAIGAHLDLTSPVRQELPHHLGHIGCRARVQPTGQADPWRHRVSFDPELQGDIASPISESHRPT